MTLKNCKDCLEDKPRRDFYDHPASADGKGTYCKVCIKKRTAASRDEKKSLGLTVDALMKEVHEVRAVNEGYVDRHEARREKERKLEVSRLSFDLQSNAIEVSSASAFVGLIDGMLRPQTKVSTWAIR